MKLEKVALGTQGQTVPGMGLGCMGMTGFEEGNIYGQADEQEAIATIHRSLLKCFYNNPLKEIP